MHTLPKLLLILAALFFISPDAEAQIFGKSAKKRRAGIQEMREEVLKELYESRPQTEKEIKNAAGYAVFSNVGVTALLISAGGGTGVAHDNRSGAETYMKMATAGLSIGLGVKDFRAVFVFHDPDSYDFFIDKGWDFSGSADAAAEVDGLGGDLSEGANVDKKVSVYQFTKNGLALSASLAGTKYWKDKKLNR